jgi:hypothetical protein
MAWETTTIQYLLKNSESGRYYARLKKEGKQIWKRLETDVYSVAQSWLAKHVQETKSARKTTESVSPGPL